MPKVFISYRHVPPDEGLALDLCRSLEQAGFEVFVDQKILAGRRWVDEIRRQLGSADHFVVLLSAESIRSDMVRQEVADSHVLAQSGKLRIYPIRIDFDAALPYDLGAYLNPLQYLTWKLGDDWALTCDRLVQAVRSPDTVSDARLDGGAEALRRLAEITSRTGAPLPAADPRLETGAMDVDSPFYVKRTLDGDVLRLAVLPSATALIMGARQVGKTSLLTRAKNAAEREGHRVVYIDFQLVDPAHLESLTTLTKYLAHRMARTLRTTVKPADVWDDYLGAPESLTNFIEEAALAGGTPVAVCLDEVDRVFDYEYRNAFFAMVRAWHNRRATHQVQGWKAFGLFIAHSTEPALFIDDVNQSPFNVGEVFRLGDFDASEIGWLNEQHGRPLSSADAASSVRQLLGGHPYLVRQALYVLAAGRIGSLADLIATASDDSGPFGDHLRRHLWALSRRTRVCAAFKQIVHGRLCDDEGDFQRLKAAGLADGPSRESARVRCDLYQRYFSKHL